MHSNISSVKTKVNFLTNTYVHYTHEIVNYWYVSQLCCMLHVTHVIFSKPQMTIRNIIGLLYMTKSMLFNCTLLCNASRHIILPFCHTITKRSKHLRSIWTHAILKCNFYTIKPMWSSSKSNVRNSEVLHILNMNFANLKSCK